MPLHEYDAATMAAHLSRLEPELSYLLDELEIPEEVQANLSAREIKKIGVFAKVEPTEELFREWLKADLGLNPATSVGERVTVAKMAEAWEASRQRATTSRKLEAEARVSGQTREMLKGVHLALRRACARTHGTVEDRRCPGRAYLENRLEQLDDGELEAEPLSKVTTVAIEQETVSSSVSSGVDVRRDGLLHVVKGKRTAPLPSGPEQYRAVMKVMALHWEMVHLKGAGRAILKDYTVQVFDRHVDYILGDECHLIGEANPTMCCGPTWDLLMKYEFEVRKRAIRTVNEGGATLAEAMVAARTSIEHRTSYFITPLAMPHSRIALPPASSEPRGNKRPAEEAFGPSDRGAAPPPSSGKGGPKGGKNANKAKTKQSNRDTTIDQLKKLSARAAYRVIRSDPDRFKAQFKGADGVPRCHNFQMGACTASGCKYTHICLRCGGAHSIVRCPELGLDKR